ncbi:MAG: helix-turn-helix domain-containing protein [Planctomycetota bacterium]
MSTSRFLSIGALSARPDWVMKAHLHPHHQMLALTRGRQFVRLLGEELAVEAGDAVLFPANAAHYEWTDAERPHEVIFVQFEWDGYRPGIELKVPDSKRRITTLMEWLLDERDSAGPAPEKARERFLQAILAEFARLAARPATDMPSRIREYVRAHLDEKLSLDRLARRAGLSKYHFLRRYKQLTGLAPMRDVRRSRLETARDLLLTSDLPLKAIAPRVGLAGEYHLSRLLRKHFGAGARQLRRYT